MREHARALWPLRGVVTALVLLVAWGAGADPIVVLQVDRDLATGRLAAAVRQLLQERGHKLREPPREPRGRSPAPASNFAREYEQRFKAGLKLYEDLEFRRSREALKAALRLCRDAMLQGDPGKWYLRILHYLAAASFYDDDRQDARRHYMDAVAFAPGRAPDKTIFSPDVLAVFKKARSNSSKNPGKLKVATRPPAARMELDGVSAGMAPVEWSELAPGYHLLVARSGKGRPHARWVVVPKGKTVTLSLDVASTAGPAPVTATAPVAGTQGLSELLGSAAAELDGGLPGRATISLVDRLNAQGGLVTVSAAGGQARLGWAEGERWVRRYRGRLEPGGERTFAERFLESSSVGQPVTEQQDCASPRPGPGCPQRAGRTPIYKRWWLWTLIGVAAGGAAVGIYFGVRSRSSQWTAEVLPREAN